MTPEELIAFSMYDEVDIESSTTIPTLDLLSCDFKGCHPLRISKLPLYLAIHLRQMNLCTIRTPEYLSKDFIEKIIQVEKKEQNFVEVPEYLFEHAHIFMNNDIESSISELRRLRHLKIFKGLSSMDGKALCINGLTVWEYNEVRVAITEAMKIGEKIERDSLEFNFES